MKVGIIGGQGEQHSMHMKSLLEDRGAEVLFLDTLNFPKHVSFSLRDDKPNYNSQPLTGVRSLYNRSVFYSQPPYDINNKLGDKLQGNLDGWYRLFAAERERQSLLGSWVRAASLDLERLVNPIGSMHLHYLKPYQLVLLKQAGVKIPSTLVTNNIEELLEFKESVGRVIYKPVAGGAMCRELTQEDLTPERLKLLVEAPVLFQEYHPGLDIRVFVLDDKVLCAISVESDEVDFRGSEKEIKLTTLPKQVEEMCITAARCCSLKFTGIDLKLSNGEYILLECNPSPMFIGFQKKCGYEIDKALADYLMFN